MINAAPTRWDDFLADTELKFSREPVPVSCSAGDPRFRNIILDAAKHHIPGGYIRSHISNLSDTAKTLIADQCFIRTQNPHDPNLHTIEQRIASEIAANKRRVWEEEVEGCSHKKDPSNYWGLLGKLTVNKKNTASNQPIEFNKRLTQAISK